MCWVKPLSLTDYLSGLATPFERRGVQYAVANMVAEMSPEDAYNFCCGVLGMSEYRYEKMVEPIVRAKDTPNLSALAKKLVYSDLPDTALIRVPSARAVSWLSEVDGMDKDEIAKLVAESEGKTETTILGTISEWYDGLVNAENEYQAFIAKILGTLAGRETDVPQPKSDEEQ